MRPFRYSINVTLDGCCDHRAMLADDDLHRHAVEELVRCAHPDSGWLARRDLRPLDECLLPSPRARYGASSRGR